MNRSLIIACSTALFALAGALLPPAAGAAGIQTTAAGPGGIWEGIPIPAAVTPPDPGWSVRTGYRKGVRDQILPEELFAGPDGAVLRNGAYAEWTGLLATFRESAVLVGPDELAALALTKPYLVIPSDGLAGFSSSAYFRAGLAEYVRSGGVVLCFSQRRGSDFAALPVDAGEKLEASGWSEDSGPVFRASEVRAVHPVLARISNDTPSVETSGYLSALPKGAVVLLARRDGKPTLALYPCGKGWVAVTSLFSGRLYGQGLLAEDERLLVNDLVLWAKAGGRPEVLAPGERLSARLALRGAEHEAATTVRVFVTGRADEHPRDMRDFPVAVAPLSDAELSFTYTLPPDIAPGIYHLAYALLDGRKALTPPVEASTGWFAVLPKNPPIAAGPSRPIESPDLRVSVLPSVAIAGNRAQLHIDVTGTAGTAASYQLLGRAAGEDIYLRLDKGRGSVTFELPAGRQGPLSFAIYHVEGRALIKGTAPASIFTKAAVAPDRVWYEPGRTMAVRVSTGAAGSLRLSGLGTEREEMTSGSTELQVPVPQFLPAGLYPLAWDFETSRGTHEQGSVPVEVLGEELLLTGMTVTGGGEQGARTALLSVHASADLRGTVRLSLTGPDGTTTPAAEAPFSVKKGAREIAVPFLFKPSSAGIWRLSCKVLTNLPEGPGFAREPLELASGTALIDAGDAAVLDLRTDPPLTYAPARSVRIVAAAAGAAGTRVEVRVDGKRISKERIGRDRMVVITGQVKDLDRRTYRITASLSGESLDSLRETRFLSGALLPDLAVSLKTSGLKYPAMDVGVGVTNKGREASTATTASLYEGDPRSGGKLVRSFPVPPLEPGKELVVIIPWPLAGKAGKKDLVAVVNENGSLLETSMENDRADAIVDVPGVLLSLTSAKTEYRADEPIDYRVRLANFSNAPLRALSVQLALSDPSGRSRPIGTVAIPEVAPGSEHAVDRVLDVTAPQEGAYLISARLSSDGKPLADDSHGISVLPTLAVQGSLDGTADSAMPCRPFDIRTRIWDAGNVRPTGGSLRLDIRSRNGGRVVSTQTLPLALDRRTIRIDTAGFPPGDYRIILSASVTNKERGMSENVVLAGHPLTVTDAVTVKRSSADIPRVLVWAGGDKAAPIQHALIGKIVKEAFAGEPSYLVVVGTAKEFAAREQTGVFTDLVLIDIDETDGAEAAVRSGLERGSGVVIAGAGKSSRSLAGALGFHFEPVAGAEASSLTIPPGSVLDLTGSLPLSGAALTPRAKSAGIVATFPGGRPAILLDAVGKGKIMVLPFSLTRSALDSGISSVYSRLLNRSVLATLPREGVRGGAVSEALIVSSPAGPVRTRIVETLPPGADLLWTSDKPSQANGTLTFELTAESEPKTLLYLLRPAGKDGRTVSGEIFSECEGKFVSQGKIE